MKARNLIVLITFMGILVSGCQPDLVVDDFEITGDITWDIMSEKARVPVRVVVTNIGRDKADSFHVEMEQIWDEENFTPVCFRDPEHSDSDPSSPSWCDPRTDGPLMPGSTVTFTGEVIAYYIVSDPFFLRAKADAGYCGVTPPDYCKVAEINEDNNESGMISVSPPGDRAAIGP
jgi:hypothetical protein